MLPMLLLVISDVISFAIVKMGVIMSRKTIREKIIYNHGPESVGHKIQNVHQMYKFGYLVQRDFL